MKETQHLEAPKIGINVLKQIKKYLNNIDIKYATRKFIKIISQIVILSLYIICL